MTVAICKPFTASNVKYFNADEEQKANEWLSSYATDALAYRSIRLNQN